MRNLSSELHSEKYGLMEGQKLMINIFYDDRHTLSWNCYRELYTIADDQDASSSPRFTFSGALHEPFRDEEPLRPW